MKLSKIFKDHSIVGVAGNRSSAKSSLVLDRLLDIKTDYPNVPIAVYGVEEALQPYLIARGFIVLTSTMDILDLQLRDCIVYIDEFGMLFDPSSKSKQLNKLSRFFDRLEHMNVKIIMSTAREGFFNKYMCSRITCFLVKEIEYPALVNGTWLKERVSAIHSHSDYRLQAGKEYYYVVSNKGELTTKNIFGYNKDLDSKKDNKCLFGKVPKSKEEITN